MDIPVSSVRVLVVDPNGEVQRRLADVLPRLTGMEVRAVGRALQVWEALEQWRPQVVLLETKRPDGRGLALCKEILARAPRVRLLVVTSYLDPWEQLETLLAGAAGYILKEVDAEALAETLIRVATSATDESVEV